MYGYVATLATHPIFSVFKREEVSNKREIEPQRIHVATIAREVDETMKGKPWTTREVELVRQLWPSHGTTWDTWDSLLPGRTRLAIDAKARNLGLVMEPSAYHVGAVDDEEPLGCPFCGEEPVVELRRDDIGGRPRWWVRCDNATCWGNAFAIHAQREVAVNHWNRRES